MVLKLCFQVEVNSTNIHGILYIGPQSYNTHFPFVKKKKKRPPVDPCISLELATHTTILYNLILCLPRAMQSNLIIMCVAIFNLCAVDIKIEISLDE